jgi:hypothetical protein
MKKLIIILILLSFFLLPLACHASDVAFEWDCGECLDITGFKLYQSKVSGIYDPNKPALIINDPLARSATVQNLTDGIYYWVCTAFEEHIATPGLPPIYNESAKSNEVSIDLDTFPPAKPGLEIKAIIKIMMQNP